MTDTDEIRETFARASQRFEAVSDKVRKGPLPAPQGFAQEAQYQDAFREFDNARRTMISAGLWEGPIPIPLRAKYRS